MAQASSVTRIKDRHPGWLSRYARKKKLEFFFQYVRKDAAILDVGCADGWLKEWARVRGWWNVTGVDLVPPADVVGDISKWRQLGLPDHSFDVIVAFEVVEHGDLAEALCALLKPDGQLMVTTPVPSLDWACKVMEGMGLLQRRTGEHTHLVDLRNYPRFRVVERRTKGLVAQWAILAPR
jgi:2-polyprenyl-3-methyl-5-hydroxy-6-metoxy-1,4-benzoquinol methylase